MSVLEFLTRVLVSVGGGAVIVAFLVRWLAKVWATSIAETAKARHAQELEHVKMTLNFLVEAERARFGAGHRALELILQRRIDTYPDMYAFVSNILKTSDPVPTAKLELPKAISEFNQLDSHTSIWMSVETSNCCYAFRHALLMAGSRTYPGASEPFLTDLRRKAENLEHALRTDIGLAGMRLSEDKLGIEPAPEGSY
jgi:hypothetical protein